MDYESGIIIYNTPDGHSKVALMARDGKVWLNQQSIAELFGTSKQNVSWHIANILNDNELTRESVVKDYLTTAYWKQSVNAILSFQEKDILSGKGVVSNEQAETKAREEYENFDARRKEYDALQADQDDIKELEAWSASTKS